MKIKACITFFIFTVVSYFFSLPTLALVQDSCHILKSSDPKRHISITIPYITQPGEYCLEKDIISPRRSSFAEGEYYVDTDMLGIKASNVIVDLRGYTIAGETSGISGAWSGYWKDTPSQKNITLRNGTLKSRTQSTINFNTPPYGTLLSDFPIAKNKLMSQEELRESQIKDWKDTLKKLPSNIDDYEKTNYLIERMKIKASTECHGCVAIGMKGAANIIRNSTIEITDGGSTIFLFGPNQIIENNIIIFKGKAGVESAAAIKLHQGDNTIIRNNDIIIESTGADAPKAAISLVNSKNVQIEGNRIYGIKTLVHAWDEQSTSVEKNNDFRSMLRRPWTNGEAGVH